MKVQDLYAAVTKQIIADLESGVPSWVRPWRDSRVPGVGMIPSNLETGRIYSGSNILLLWMAAQQRGFDSLQFCTYQQAQRMGAKVKKSEKATSIIFTKHGSKKDEESGEEKPSTIVKAYAVFNVGQLEGVPDKYLHAQQPLDLEEPRLKVRDLVNAAGIDVRFGYNRACYIPKEDCIQMPAYGAFEDEAAFTSTLMHESVHWTSHAKRLDRKISTRFASPEHAFEELVAEIGAAYVCGRLGYEPHTRSASYLESWLKVLKSDTRAIFTASSYAGHAATYLWELGFGKEETRQAA